MNLKKIIRILHCPVKDIGLFPITIRIGVYGILLLFILEGQASLFDTTELITVLSFTIVATIIEMILVKVQAGKTVYWHLISFIVLACFLGLTMNQINKVHMVWRKNQVISSVIKSTLEDAPWAVITADEYGTIQCINKKASDLLGWRPEEISNKPLSILMRPGRYGYHEEAFNKEVQSTIPNTAKWLNIGEYPFRIVDKNKTLKRVDIKILEITYDNKDIEFYAFVQSLPLVQPKREDDSE